MSYLVFARKYRPQNFDQVVQQEHVTRTLANAIASGRVAHAILFSGPRGTGKTTVARILAKAMNCIQGPTSTPCNHCQSCEEITAGHAADVFEIDGASNNSVDQVRELRENLKYMPVHSRHKIYIIDEVHMLSLAAFNALLKTLEEPPEHILFMFATTELQKIPITILSRCQRHDLRRIDREAIAGYLRHICQQDQVEIDDQSLSLISQEAGGSMRDGLSLLDHVLACAQGPVTAQLISELLGVVDRKHLFDLSDAVLKGDIQQVLEGIDAIWRNGYELKKFYADLTAHFHHLTFVKAGPRASRLVDLPAHEIEIMKTQVADIPDSYLLQIFDLLFQAETAIKLSSQPKLALEMVFIKLFQTPPTLPIETLIHRLDQLQLKIGTGEVKAIPASELTRPTTEESVQQNFNREEDETTTKTKAADKITPKANPAMDIDALWKQVMTQVSEEKPSLAAFLNKCSLHSMADNSLELEVKGNAFTLKNVTKHLPSLEQKCSNCMGRSVKLNVVANMKDAAAKQELKKKTSRLKQEAMSHPLVMEALELFNGRVVEIKVP